MSTVNYKNVLEAARQKWNSGDLNGYIETLYDPNCTFHFLPPGLPRGVEGARLFYGGFMTGFPNSQFTAEEMIMEGDKLVVRYRLQATHRGEFNGIPPTGKQATLNGITILRFTNGKVVERWNETDFLGFLQQLGVIPS
jgi:predicted ester cyclase